MRRKPVKRDGPTCSWGHPWTAENTYVWTSATGRTMRICRKCRAERMNLYRKEPAGAEHQSKP